LLKHIPANLTPELLKLLMEMGHGDEIVIADGNFPAASHAQRLVRLDGQSIPEVLESMMKLFPLDTYAKSAVLYMATAEGDADPEIWEEYFEIFKKAKEAPSSIRQLERFEFYDRAKKAYAIIATSETALYANVILKKGVIA
jgi:L-fucose mutarotase